MIDHLRSGGTLNASHCTIASKELSNDGIWVCGADYMTDNLLASIPPSAQQMIDVMDGKGLFAFEIGKDQFKTITFDFDGALGQLSMRLRAPIWISRNTTFEGTRIIIEENKVVPLPPEFESPCSALFAGQLPRMVFFADGTFKLIKT